MACIIIYDYISSISDLCLFSLTSQTLGHLDMGIWMEFLADPFKISGQDLVQAPQRPPQAKSKNNSFNTNWRWLNSKFLSDCQAPCSVYNRRETYSYMGCDLKDERLWCVRKGKIYSLLMQNKVRMTLLACLPAPYHIPHTHTWFKVIRIRITKLT